MAVGVNGEPVGSGLVGGRLIWGGLVKGGLVGGGFIGGEFTGEMEPIAEDNEGVETGRRWSTGETPLRVYDVWVLKGAGGIMERLGWSVSKDVTVVK